LSYDFIAFGILRSKMQRGEPLIPMDDYLGAAVWIGLAVFLFFHIVSFIFIAIQFKDFKKASVLRIIALILGIASCIFILNDIACLSDIGKEYAEGLEVEFEWKSLYATNVLHGIFFLIMLATGIEALIHRRKQAVSKTAIKDEVLFTVVHSIGVICGAVGLLGAFAAFIENRAHPLLHYTFPFLFILTLTPYCVLAGYWLILKFKEKPAEWYDEKQFQDISRAGLVTTLLTIPFMALHYIVNYASPLGPIHILWFPFYLYFVNLIFSGSSLIFSRMN
jgi:hypothetical protein